MEIRDTMRHESIFEHAAEHVSEEVREYLRTVSPRAEELTRTFERSDRPMADTAVIIPIALAQDGHRVHDALEQYARQADTADPFTVFLYLNDRRNNDNDARRYDRLSEVLEATEVYKDQLDVRVACGSYDEPTIGEIRKDAWDGVVGLAHREGVYDTPHRDVVGINHDIDSQWLHPRYIRQVQAEYDCLRNVSRDEASELILPIRTTRVLHGVSAEHPNTSRAIAWNDYVEGSYFRAVGGGYEAGMTVPFRHYAHKGGFAKTAIHETRPLISGASPIAWRQIGSTALVTSPRRYIQRFPQRGYEDIWTEDSFNDIDPCRRKSFKELPDATEHQLTQHTLNHMPRHAAVLCGTVIDQYENEGIAQPLKNESPEQRFARLFECQIALGESALKNIGFADDTTGYFRWLMMQSQEITSKIVTLYDEQP